MDLRSAAQTIRDTVNTADVVALYGYRVKHGFMVCPFHGDRDASLKVYPGTKGWHCFGCGKGGSVIDFVMEQEGCDFRTAVHAIDSAMHLGLNDPHEDPWEAERTDEMQAWADRTAVEIGAYCDRMREKTEEALRTDLARLKDMEEKKADGRIDEMTPADFDFMGEWKEISQRNEYRLEHIERLREGVAEWRRMIRRARSA